MESLDKNRSSKKKRQKETRDSPALMRQSSTGPETNHRPLTLREMTKGTL